MASGWCPECDILQTISPTGEAMSLRGKETLGKLYWRIDLHRCRGPLRFVCEGSGEKV